VGHNNKDNYILEEVMKYRIISALLVLVMLTGIAFAATTTWRHSGFTLWSYDIDMNGLNLTNASNVSAKHIGGILYADQYSDIMTQITSTDSDYVIFFPEGTYSNLATYEPTTKDRIIIRGAGKDRTILKSNPANLKFLNFSGGSGFKIEDVSIDCMGIALCIDFNNTGGSVVQSNNIRRSQIYNATYLIDFSNSEEGVVEHSIIGSSPSQSEYGVIVNTSGGNLRFYNTIFFNNSRSGVLYNANTQISFFSPVFTQGGSEGQLQVQGTNSPRIWIYEPWFELSTGHNINSTSPDTILGINGGYFHTGTTNRNINGTFTRLDITGTPTFLSSGNLNLNVFATNFWAPTTLSLDKGINTQEGNSSHYWYHNGAITYYTNMTSATG